MKCPGCRTQCPECVTKEAVETLRMQAMSAKIAAIKLKRDTQQILHQEKVTYEYRR